MIRDAPGNNLLFDLLGVERRRVVPAGTPLMPAMEEMAAEARGEGHRPYVIAGGGSVPLGALGYVACAAEIMAQCFEMGVAFDRIVLASGSGGTHAGMLAGLAALHADVRGDGHQRAPPASRAGGQYRARGCGHVRPAGDPAPRRPTRVTCLDRWVGPGYSLPTPEMVEAVRMTASHEAVLLDPVYTGKAMAGLIGLAREGALAARARAVPAYRRRARARCVPRGAGRVTASPRPPAL